MAVKPSVKTVTATAGIVAAIALFTSSFEGLRTKAYPDPAGPRIATICYGETQGVHFGDTATPTECLDMLKGSIPKYLDSVDKLMPNLPDNRRIAYADFAYNAGAGNLTKRRSNIAGTSIVDLERAGKPQEACHRLTLFDYAGGQRMAGLTRRRQAEYSLCMETW